MSPSSSLQSSLPGREEDSLDGVLEALRRLQTVVNLIDSQSQPAEEDIYSAFGNHVADVLREMSIVRGDAFVSNIMSKINEVLMDMWDMLGVSRQPQLPPTSASPAVIQKTLEQPEIQEEDTL